MNRVSKNRTKYLGAGGVGCLMMSLMLVLPLWSDKAGLAVENDSVEHFRMISTVEYVGQGQFRNQVDELFTVREKPLSNDKVQHNIFEFENGRGLSSVLAGTVPLEKAIQAGPVKELDILSCGPEVPNPSEILNSDAFAEILKEELCRRYDRIIIDSSARRCAMSFSKQHLRKYAAQNRPLLSLIIIDSSQTR